MCSEPLIHEHDGKVNVIELFDSHFNQTFPFSSMIDMKQPTFRRQFTFGETSRNYFLTCAIDIEGTSFS